EGRPAVTPATSESSSCSVFLICSQLVTTSLASFTCTSPNTCGGRRTSLACTARATSATVNAPASAASTDWIITWNSRSPSSSSSASYAPGGTSPAGASGGSSSIASTTS